MSPGCVSHALVAATDQCSMRVLTAAALHRESMLRCGPPALPDPAG